MDSNTGLVLGVLAILIFVGITLAKPDEEGVWSCPYCNAKFGEYNELKSHMQTHINERIPINIGWR